MRAKALGVAPAAHAIKTEKVHSMREAASLFGVSVATWKRYVEAGIVPAPVRIGPRRVGWLDSELAATQQAWRAARSNGEARGS